MASRVMSIFNTLNGSYLGIFNTYIKVNPLLFLSQANKAPLANSLSASRLAIRNKIEK